MLFQLGNQRFQNPITGGGHAARVHEDTGGGKEPLVPQQAGPALVATASSSPPYGGTLTVPLDAIGKMRLLAVGEVARGRFGGREEFDEILVQVEPSAPLNGIEFEAEKPWRLGTIGKIVEVPVVGQFADEVTRRIGGVSAGST